MGPLEAITLLMHSQRSPYLPIKRSGKTAFALNNQNFKINGVVTEEMVQRVKVLTAFAEDPGSVPSTHLVAHNQMKLQFQGICYSSGHLGHQACIQHTDTYVHKMKTNTPSQKGP